jgi:hypothetical protein
MPKLPKWATPERQSRLVDLFLRSQGFCVFGHKPCPYPEHHYEVFTDDLIKDWVADDRAQAIAEWREEQKSIHNLGERRYTRRGEWSAVGQDVFYGGQPQFYILGYGVSGLTFRPFAVVRLASSFVRLQVDLGDCLKAVSKSKRRKAIRHGKGGAIETVHKAIAKAIRDYLK